MPMACRRRRMENLFVNTLVNTGRELVLFDAGNGRARMPTAGKLPDLLVMAGYKPEQVDVVVITHGHPDHIGGLMEGEAASRPIPMRATYSERPNSIIGGRATASATHARLTATSS